MNGQAVRDLFNEVIKQYVTAGGGRVNWVIDEVQRKATDAEVSIGPEFHQVVIEHFWTLARSGIIAIMPRDPAVVPGNMPEEERRLQTFVITELGCRILAEPIIAPYDWAKYQALVRLKVATPDEVVLVHLGEAVFAWQAGSTAHPRSCSDAPSSA